jgi:polysaccharide biosynthesis/export protein
MTSKSGNGLSRILWAALTLCLGSVGCHSTASFLDPTPAKPVVQPAAQPYTPSLKLPNALPEIAGRSGPDGRPVISQSDYHVQELPSAKPAGAADSPPAKPVVGVPSASCPAAAALQGAHDAPRLPIPNEKAKTFLPAYVIEPPDVLTIDGIRLIPRPPYRIEPLDVLLISVPEALPNQPIAGPYTVTPEGTVYLGTSYGAIRVSGLTLEQAAAAIKAGLRLNNPQVSVALGQFRGVQQVRGDHIVGQDGTITLGTFGCVNVTGLTLSQAKCEIERHLSRWLLDPLVSVSVSGYNSKVYYVITDGAGFGQQVYRLPITGNETVLDAISLVGGLSSVSSKRRIWLARPTPAQTSCYEILPVNWEAITEAGSTDTNWQIFPGDRVYVKADPFITFDNQLSKILSPMERLFGATLLGTSTVQSFRGINGNNNTGGIVPVF